MFGISSEECQNDIESHDDNLKPNLCGYYIMPKYETSLQKYVDFAKPNVKIDKIIYIMT